MRRIREWVTLRIIERRCTNRNRGMLWGWYGWPVDRIRRHIFVLFLHVMTGVMLGPRSFCVWMFSRATRIVVNFFFTANVTVWTLNLSGVVIFVSALRWIPRVVCCTKWLRIFPLFRRTRNEVPRYLFFCRPSWPTGTHFISGSSITTWQSHTYWSLSIVFLAFAILLRNYLAR